MKVDKKSLIENDGQDESQKSSYGRRAAYSQIVAALVPSFIYIIKGFSFGMSTVIIGALGETTATNKTKIETPDLIISPITASWLGSIFFLVCLCGCIGSGYMTEIVGRKRLLVATMIPYFLGWLSIYFATTVHWILLGTIVLGIKTGTIEPPSLSYVGEISLPKMRGPLNACLEAGFNAGTLGIYLIYAVTKHWHHTILVCSLFPIIGLCLAACIPESPSWLTSKNRLIEAEKSLRWLRGWSNKEEVSIEFTQMTDAISKPVDNNTDVKKKPSLFKLLKRPEIFRAFKMIVILFFLNIIVALKPMKPFQLGVYHEFKTPIEPEWLLVLTGVLNIAGSIFSALTVQIFGKRNLALWCLFLNFFCIAALGECSISMRWSGWMSVYLFCASTFIAAYGVVPLPIMLISEVYSQDVRGVMAGFSAGSFFILLVITTKMYINLTIWFGMYGTMYLYSAISILGFLYVYFFVPTTEGRSVHDIISFFAENQSVYEFANKYKSKKSKEKSVKSLEI